MWKLFFLEFLRTNKRNAVLCREEERGHRLGAEGGKYDENTLDTRMKI